MRPGSGIRSSRDVAKGFSNAPPQRTLTVVPYPNRQQPYRNVIDAFLVPAVPDVALLNAYGLSVDRERYVDERENRTYPDQDVEFGHGCRPSVPVCVQLVGAAEHAEQFWRHAWGRKPGRVRRRRCRFVLSATGADKIHSERPKGVARISIHIFIPRSSVLFIERKHCNL